MTSETDREDSQTPEEDGVKYYMNGQMYKKMTYSDGVLDGPWSQFYPKTELWPSTKR